jgi:hypothetical protein
MKKEHPILFSTPMVQAILEGRKTQTRRTRGLKTLNEKPTLWELMRLELDPVLQIYKNFFLRKEKKLSGLFSLFRNIKTEDFAYSKCPYGQPGDLLWVREKTIRNNNSNTYWPVADGYLKTADYEKTIPSIHMPKNAARIWLKVKDVRVERVNDISEEDAIEEGVEKVGLSHKFKHYNPESNFTKKQLIEGCPLCFTAKKSFETLWCKINGEQSWDANPWVWVITFEELSRTGRPEPETCNLEPETCKL